MKHSSARRDAARQDGFVLLAVLLLSVLMVSMTMSYARHALLSADINSANQRAQAAEQAAGSGLAWAKQSLLADGARSATFRLGGGAGVTVSVADTGSDKRGITVAANGPGTSQQVAATAETYATTNGTLPTLTSAAKSAVAGDATRLEVSGSQTYADTELTGILYVRFGAQLTLRNVVLTGTIVSEAAMVGSWTPAQASTITLDKGVLIEPGSTLPGCAIIAPDAAIAGSGAERVQIQGVIVAAELSLTGSGALHQQVITSRTPVIASAIDMPNAGRAPQGWPALLDTGAEGFSRLVFLRSDATQGEKDAIGGFVFPARAAAPARGGG